MANHLGDVFGTLPQGIIAYPVGPEIKWGFVHTGDVGDAAAKLLLAKDPSTFHGCKLDVSGPETLPMGELADLYTEFLGRAS